MIVAQGNDLPFKPNKITHSSYCEIDHEVHAPGMQRVNEIDPVVDDTPMRIEDSEVQGRVTIGLPRHVNEWCARNEDCLDAHSLKVIELSSQPLEVSTVAQLGLPPIVFVHRLEEIIVRWVAIGELVEKDGIEGERAPVFW